MKQVRQVATCVGNRKDCDSTLRTNAGNEVPVNAVKE